MGHVEIISQRGALLELAVEHILAVVWIASAVKGLLGPVVKAGNPSRGVEEREGDF